ncbi:hypothetical protein TNCV_4276391 [Trichonephila clavipes]|nr:hypothetical protein TNCV_4276391 [Trichonephila clavipes]
MFQSVFNSILLIEESSAKVTPQDVSNDRLSQKLYGLSRYHSIQDNMLTKYQMIKFIDFCEVWFLPESVARVAAIVGDHRCHTPRH